MNFHRHPAQLHPHGVRAEVPVPVTVKPQARVTRVRMPVREAASVPDLRAVRSRFTENFRREAADGLKVLGNGNVDKKFTVRAAAFTAAAKEKIEAAGGKCEVV